MAASSVVDYDSDPDDLGREGQQDEFFAMANEIAVSRNVNDQSENFGGRGFNDLRVATQIQRDFNDFVVLLAEKSNTGKVCLGSGVVVNGNKIKLLLTAAHCLTNLASGGVNPASTVRAYVPNLKYYNDSTIGLRYKMEDKRFRVIECESGSIFVYPPYERHKNSHSGTDFGLILLPQTRVTSYLNSPFHVNTLCHNPPQMRVTTLYGYPGQHEKSYELYEHTCDQQAVIVRGFDVQHQLVQYHNISSGGQSGGALVSREGNTTQLVAIHVNGVDDGVKLGTKITPVIYEWIKKLENNIQEVPHSCQFQDNSARKWGIRINFKAGRPWIVSKVKPGQAMAFGVRVGWELAAVSGQLIRNYNRSDLAELKNYLASGSACEITFVEHKIAANTHNYSAPAFHVATYDYTESEKQQILTACAEGQAGTLNALLAKDGDFEIADGRGNTPLILAAKNAHLNVARILIQKGADLETTNCLGWTPFYQATERANLQMVQFLHKAGSDVNVQEGQMQMSPMILASYYGFYPVANYLLQHCDVDLTLRDYQGKTAQEVAYDRKTNRGIRFPGSGQTGQC